ncbi:Putative transposase of IS4/5 family [Kosakonia arachidis]|uniref:Putative transposase of IS4/5 family n=1 Tax=Kosakonia arachidis TaxID=551989 RepID=A0A1I6ZQB9_9ENTR|nr:Putative transposase of IS4/5 family [Kosakonia arachidis]
MAHYVLPDEIWALIQPLLPAEPATPRAGRPWAEHCIIINSMFRVLCSGISGATISAWLDEGEVLYPPETCFQVTAGSYLEYGWHIGAKVYRLKEVFSPMGTDKVPFLTDVAKLQRQQMNHYVTH